MIGDKYLGETLALANHPVFDCLLPEKKNPRTIVIMDNDTLAGKKYKKLRVHSYSLLRNCTKLLIIKAFEACTLKFIGRLKEFLSCILIDKFDKSAIGDKILETLSSNGATS